jgi:hypothetical protein
MVGYAAIATFQRSLDFRQRVVEDDAAGKQPHTVLFALSDATLRQQVPLGGAKVVRGEESREPVPK